MWPVQPISSSIGPTELARKMSAQSHRGVQERRADQQDREGKSRVVVAAERLGPLKAANGGIERGGVRVEGVPLRRGEAGGIEGLQQGTSGGADLLESLTGAERGRRRTDRPPPAKDRQRGGDRAETDQDEEDTLMEGEPHRS